MVIPVRDLAAHNGYPTWHRELDEEISQHIANHPRMSPQEFEAYLRERYAKPDLVQRSRKDLIDDGDALLRSTKAA